MTDEPSTNLSLLARLQQEKIDSEAWRLLVDRYGPHILRWCRSRKLQDADARDTTQEVLIKIFQAMTKSRYDRAPGGFCHWLRRVTRNVVTDFRRSPKWHTLASGDSGTHGILDAAEAPRTLEEVLEDAYDLELLEEAKRRVEARVPPPDWEVFRQVVLEDGSAKRTAQARGTPAGSIRSTVCRVKKLLREEMYGPEDQLSD